MNIRKIVTTYNIGLLQSKAYRILKFYTADILSQYGLTSIEWALLGQLLDNNEGLKFVEVAGVLGVEAPFVTVLVDGLEKKGLVLRQNDTKDRRAKRITLTALGESKVPEVELVLRKDMKKLLSDISRTDILCYLKVLDSIVQNSDKTK